MKLHEGVAQDLNLVRSWSADGLRVGGALLPLPCLLAARELKAPWPAALAWDTLAAALDEILALEPRLLLIGTGSRQRFAPAALRQRCESRGVAVECMDGAAACRTYNVLVQEERAVVLLAMPDNMAG
ncbi:MAG: hypothetical protein RL026_266 [Pseudomonadota bacterium]|jgi:uncharacterized protein